MRNPATQVVYGPDNQPNLMLSRGYTGHEHLPSFGLINMNARLYDPLVGRFLSPDPFVQMPDYSQNFNRYSYGLNNPLKFTDPNGEWLHLLIGAVVGGAINLGVKAFQGKITSIGSGLAAFGIGAAAGVAAAATGGLAFTTVAGSGATIGSGGFIAGSISSVVGSAVSMPIQSLGNSAVFGDPFMTGKEYLTGLGVSAVTGGIINGGAAAINGNNFWSGNEIARGRNLFSFNNKPVPIPKDESVVLAPLEAVPLPKVESGISQLNDKISLQQETPIQQARRLGKEAEMRLGMPETKTGIKSLSGKAKIRYPDHVTTEFINESKNVKVQTYTPQLHDYLLHAKEFNKPFTLFTRPSTIISPSLQKVFDNGDIIHGFIPIK